MELPTAAPSAASMPRMRRSDSQKYLNSSSVSASVRLGDKVFSSDGVRFVSDLNLFVTNRAFVIENASFAFKRNRV